MQIIKCDIEGVLRIRPKVFADSRGFFTERFNLTTFREARLPTSFIQDNFSLSTKNVVRGLHFQTGPAQMKLVTAMSGVIRDVVVDIRHRSPTFGQHAVFELDGQTPEWILIPAGFAHGFSVLSESASVLYKVDAPYSPQGDGGIAWNDPELGIEWGTKDPVVSDKDRKLPSWASYRQQPKF